MNFALHPRLAADTSVAADWPLCRVLLMEDARYFWLILVPRCNNAIELIDLSRKDRVVMVEEIARASAIIRKSGAAKLNIGALGNLVPQLHLHVVGRTPGDPAWPGPVWGHSPAAPYDPVLRAERLALVRAG